LPRYFHPGDIILDVGGHIGSFSYAALVRGAGLVHCYEPSPDNAPLLEQNLRAFADRVVVHQAALFGANPPAQVHLHRSVNPVNTGGGWVGCSAAAGTVPVPVVSFDAEVERITGGGRQRIRLLKLDCEGSEWSILQTSRLLDLVDEVCGEFHLPPAGTSPERTADTLCDCLRRQGFFPRVASQTSEALGLFFATRNQVAGPSLLARLWAWWAKPWPAARAAS
jgi:FkbM family methyltransferase